MSRIQCQMDCSALQVVCRCYSHKPRSNARFWSDGLPNQRFKTFSFPKSMPREQPAAYKLHQALSICHGASANWLVVRFRSFCSCCSHKPRSNARDGQVHCQTSNFGRFRYREPCLEMLHRLHINFTRPIRYVMGPL